MILCQACYSTWSDRKALEEDIQRWPKKRGMGICLGDNDHDCLANMTFADDVLLYASSKEQLQNMFCDFKRSTEKVGLRIHAGKTKILSNQSSNIRKEIEIDNIKVEILTREESTKHLGPDDNFSAAGHDRNQKSNQGCLGNVPQEKTGADLENLHAQTSTSAFRRCGITAPHHTNENEKQKRLGNEKTRPMKTTTQKTWVALKMTKRMDKVQRRATITTATSLSRTILTMRLTQKDEECEDSMLDQDSQKNEMEDGW